MGYYSDVAMAMKKKDYAKLRQAISSLFSDAELKNVSRNLIEAAQKTEIKIDKEKYVVLKWQSIKWYNDFEEISFIEKFLEKIPHHDFIRIGEEMEDIEEYQGTHHYLIEVQRDISINSQ